ncbi:MAG: 4-(cytidine 5'-diphospho)-2-C-methyl-D-erythritol kinase [Arachnia sp.]
MSTTVRVRVPAKVNLSLRVGPTEASGYHELGTLFQGLSLFDDVIAERAPAGQFSLAFQGEGAGFLPTDDTNLAMRAAKLIARRFDVTDAGVSLLIRKRIPVAGGMAGGSADAAATLRACNELWRVCASDADLSELAASLGADVPFLLVGGTALGTGRGDVIHPVACQGSYYWALALSHSGLSTPEVFAEFDRLDGPRGVVVDEALLAAVAAGDVPAVGRLLRNDLTAAAVALQPCLNDTLAAGRMAGAIGVIVSGSGPTCAFLAETPQAADRIAQSLSRLASVRTVRRADGPVGGAQVVG